MDDERYAKVLRRLETMHTWHKFTDPDTGWLASKTTGWTADSFSGGLEVDFSAVVPVGTKAVRVAIFHSGGATSNDYWRPSGDSNVSNTPDASSEFAFVLARIDQTRAQYVIWLSSDYKAQFAASNTSRDLYIAYPVEYLL